MKKMILTIMFALIILSLVAQEGTPGLLYIRILGQDAYQVSKGNATDSEVVIASVYDGLPVTRIFLGIDPINAPFLEYTNMTSIYIPDSITYIGNNAFWGCTGLTTINIPESVTYIGNRAFSGCKNLTNITIPESLTSLSGLMFYGSGLINIFIPKNIINIDPTTFANCIDLESIMIDEENSIFRSEGDCIIQISDETLIAGCKNSIIPTTVKKIGDRAFYDMISLTNIHIPESVTFIGDEAFYGCSSLTSISIPDSVTIIDNSAFFDCNSLENIILPTGLTRINHSTFAACSSLPRINLPESVAYIGAFAFSGCRSLTNINIPERVTYINSDAFSYCSSLESIFISKNVGYIGMHAFIGCENLTIYCEVESQPDGWHHNWNPDNLPVIWGNSTEDDPVMDKFQTELYANYPNPFNPTTTIKCGIQRAENGSIEIFNIKGQKVKTLFNGMLNAGEHTFIWNGDDDFGNAVSSGIYFYKMKTSDYNEIKKMILMK